MAKNEITYQHLQSFLLPCNLSYWGNVITYSLLCQLYLTHVVRVLTSRRPIQTLQNGRFVIQISNNTEWKILHPTLIHLQVPESFVFWVTWD